MQIDLYLGFTSCFGNCIFCRKGTGLTHFSRSKSDSDYGGYMFRHFKTEESIFAWLEEDLPQIIEPIGRISISGNEPLLWKKLGFFMKKISTYQPQAEYTLRISNTVLPENPDIFLNFQRLEISLYGHTINAHNRIIENDNAWDILHKNLQSIEHLNMRERVYFQTIPIRQNIDILPNIIEYLIGDLKTKNPIKIVYPYFFPVLSLKDSLISRKVILEKLLKEVPKDILKNSCVLQNFPSLPIYSPYFRSVQK